MSSNYDDFKRFGALATLRAMDKIVQLEVIFVDVFLICATNQIDLYHTSH
jgi:hypothetical protein